MEQTIEVWLVRHGQSTFNAQQRFQGRSDEPVLTARGVEAAAATGRRLAAVPFDAVVSSPLRRARQTAEAIAAELPGAPPVAADDDLRELNLGPWQGLAIEAVRERFPEAYRAWHERPHELCLAGADGVEFYPLHDLFAQARRFWRGLRARHAGRRVLLVTHGGTARALLGTAAGIGMERFQSLQQSNCGISALDLGPRGARVEALNLTAHLGEHAPKLKAGKHGLRAVLLASGQPAAARGALDALCPGFACAAADAASRALAAALAGEAVDIVSGATPAAWHAAATGRVPAAGVATGVFVGPDAVLRGWLSQLLGASGAAALWKPLAAATVHYPGSGRAAVVQSFRASCLTWRDAPLPPA